jgi:hypothetical protein
VQGLESYVWLLVVLLCAACAYSKKIYVDKAFQKKTNALVQEHVGVDQLEHVSEFLKIDAETVELIKRQKGGDATKVINLVKSIQKAAEENSGDPFFTLWPSAPKRSRSILRTDKPVLQRRSPSCCVRSRRTNSGRRRGSEGARWAYVFRPV